MLRFNTPHRRLIELERNAFDSYLLGVHNTLTREYIRASLDNSELRRIRDHLNSLDLGDRAQKPVSLYHYLGAEAERVSLAA